MINIIGLGYIGLPTSLMLAGSGIDVVGTDINQSIIEKLRHNKVTFKEKGLEELMSKAIENKIKFSTDFMGCDTYIIAVPTPYNSETKKIDTTYLENAVSSVLEVSNQDAIIIIESTIPPGTIDSVIRPIINAKGKRCELAHAPERILPGNMVYELRHNSRTIGADSKEVGEKVKEIYSTFCEGNIVITDIRTAEMSKVVENTYRDINIAFANELAKICRSDNLDVYEIIKIANMHPRVNILSPGPGVGGHCISVDPWFLVGDYPKLANLIHTARKVNDSMPLHVIDRIDSIMSIEGIDDYDKVGLYGITYKPDVDDTRESPTLQLISHLEKNKNVKIYDPMVERKFKNKIDKFEDFINSVDLVVIMVDHAHIKANEDKLKNKTVLDTKNIIKNLPVYKL